MEYRGSAIVNSMGTSIGSRVLSLRNIILIAVLSCFLGSILVGIHVTEVIGEGIVNSDYFSLNPNIILYGMLSALITTALWISIGTYFKLPVSTTHSLISSIVGFSIIAGYQSLGISNLARIITGWIISPVVGAIIAFLVFARIKNSILNSDKVLKPINRIFPLFVFLLLFILMFSILYKSIFIRLDIDKILLISVLIAVIGGMVTYFMLGRYEKEILEKDKYSIVENLFGKLQILSVFLIGFAHGSNDVGNVSGPLLSIMKTTYEDSLPLYLLIFCALGIGAGIVIRGRVAIQDIRNEMAELAPTRGFATEFGAGSTVLTCSILGVPVSTPIVLMGAIIGVGFARGLAALNLDVVRSVVLSALTTIFATMLLSMGIYSGLLYITTIMP